MGTLFIGLMSGTSADGVDGALAAIEDGLPRLLAFASRPYEAGLRARLIAFNDPQPDELHGAATAAQGVSAAYADVVADLLRAGGVAAERIAAIGAHGQTVRHRPDAGYTVQLLDAAGLAEATGIAVVSDFRARDMAGGGQGAPLAPAFHDAVFRNPDRARVVLNLGGIANATLLVPGRDALGFDTGPANCLMDIWAERQTGAPLDRDGVLAGAGTPVDTLLDGMLAEPYFAVPPPKSTGRDLFGPAWLDRFPLARHRPADVQATLLGLTVESVFRALASLGPLPDEVLVCGGGANNPVLMGALAARFSPAPVVSTERHGIDPQRVEAIAFAWLAHRRLAGLPGNLPGVTGARGPRVLGAVHAA